MTSIKRRQFAAAMLAVVLAVGALLLTGEVFARMFGSEVGLIAPSLIIPCIFAIFFPRVRLLAITVALMYFGEFLALLAGQRNLPNSIVSQIIHQPWPWILLPPGGFALGCCTIAIIRKFGPFRWPMKNYYAVLISRPDLVFRKYWPAFALLLIGAALDTITTINCMREFGTEGELHPAMQMLGEEFGAVLGVCVGTCVRLAFVIFVAAAWRKWTATVIYLCGVLYCLAAVSNHFNLL